MLCDAEGNTAAVITTLGARCPARPGKKSSASSALWGAHLAGAVAVAVEEAPRRRERVEAPRRACARAHRRAGACSMRTRPLRMLAHACARAANAPAPLVLVHSCDGLMEPSANTSPSRRACSVVSQLHKGPIASWFPLYARSAVSPVHFPPEHSRLNSQNVRDNPRASEIARLRVSTQAGRTSRLAQARTGSHV